MKYLGFDIPDEIIDNYVDKLGCSIVDAMQAYLFDTGKMDSAEADAMTKKAQFAGVGKIVDADYKKGERKPKERKVDDDKLMIMEIINDAIHDNLDSGCVIRNTEKYIDFIYHGNHYTVNLVKHRKKGD